MFSTTLSAIANIAQEIIDFHPPLTVAVMMYGDELYDVYPGNFSKSCEKNLTQYDLYERRIQLWKNSETEEPKDEVQDNVLNKHTDAVKTIQALFQGKQTRKKVAFQHRKQFHIDEAIKRREQRLLGDQQMQDKLSLLEEENAKLKKTLQMLGTSTYNAIVKNNVEEVLHTRQVHHLRTKKKLISDI
tara:strand:+ start:907 stop:1467 length:561 start_codon:yes stop_codon:yes gene_type:complete